MNIVPFEEAYKLDSITINVTNACNLNCSYCFEHIKANEFMTPETAIDIIKKTYNKIDPKLGVFTINIFGGEPLLNWKTIKAILDYINKNHLRCKVGITTNLTILTDEMIKYFDDNSVMLLVSFDGVGHDKNRCNTHDIVVKNLKRLCNAGLSLFIEARLTITPEFGQFLYESVKEVVDLGINNICPICQSDTEWTEQQLYGFKESYKKLLDYYSDILNDDTNVRKISIKFVDELIGFNIESDMNVEQTMCHIYNTKWCTFDYNGDVYPCHQCPSSEEEHVKSMKIGNIYTGVDKDLLKEKPMTATFDRSECQNCIAKSICKSGCPIQNYKFNKDLQKPTKAHCDIFKIYAESIIKYQYKILNSTNIRSRYLNLIKENIKVKKYFDEELMTTDIHSIDFLLKLERYQEMHDNLNNKNSLLPSFETYFINKLLPLLSYIYAEKGVELINGK